VGLRLAPWAILSNGPRRRFTGSTYAAVGVPKRCAQNRRAAVCSSRSRGGHAIRRAASALMGPMLSTRLAELNRDAFVVDETLEQRADRQQHRLPTRLEDLDLSGEDGEWVSQMG
jgi:hypothetical protein